MTSARSPKYNGASLGLPVTIRPNGVFRCCWSPVCPKGEAPESNRLFPGAGCDGSRPFRPPLNSATISHFAGTPPPRVGAQTGVGKNPSPPPKWRRITQMIIDHVHPEARVACVGRTNATCSIAPWVSLKSQNHYTTSIYVIRSHTPGGRRRQLRLVFDLLLHVLACRTVLSTMLDGRICTGLRPHAQPLVPRPSAHVLARICTTTA